MLTLNKAVVAEIAPTGSSGILASTAVYICTVYSTSQSSALVSLRVPSCLFPGVGAIVLYNRPCIHNTYNAFSRRLIRTSPDGCGHLGDDRKEPRTSKTYSRRSVTKMTSVGEKMTSVVTFRTRCARAMEDKDRGMAEEVLSMPPRISTKA